MIALSIVAVVALAFVGIVVVGRAGRSDDDGLRRRPGQPELPGQQQQEVPSEPPGWDTFDEAPEVAALAPADAPLWGSAPGSPKPGALTTVFGAAVRGDTAILWGEDLSVVFRRLSVVDLASGAERWKLSEGDALRGQDVGLVGPDVVASLDPGRNRPAIVDDPGGGRGWSVVVPYGDVFGVNSDFSEPPSDRGVAALAGSDGRVLWTASVVPAPATGLLMAENVATVVAGGDTVLVAATKVDPAGPTIGDSPPESIRTVAYDAATGQERWEKPGVWPHGVSGDTAIVLEGAHPSDPLFDEDYSDQDVVALDAATGEERWRRTGQFPTDIEPVVGDVVVVEVGSGTVGRASGSELPETVVLEAASGDEVASFGEWAHDCHTDATSTIACLVPAFEDEDRVATFRVDGRDAGVSAEGSADMRIDGVLRGGGVVVYDQEPLSADRPTSPRRLVDASGAVVGSAVPGKPLVTSDRYGIFACGAYTAPCPGDADGAGSMEERYAVYALG